MEGGVRIFDVHLHDLRTNSVAGVGHGARARLPHQARLHDPSIRRSGVHRHGPTGGQHHLGVSRATLRVALDRLESEGRLQRSVQHGWFVPRLEVRCVTMDEAEKLRIAPASSVIQINRLCGMDRTPVCYDVVVLPEQRTPALATADLTDDFLYEALRQHCDIVVYRSAYSLVASVADVELAKLLGMGVGALVRVGVNQYRGRVPVRGRSVPAGVDVSEWRLPERGIARR